MNKNNPIYKSIYWIKCFILCLFIILCIDSHVVYAIDPLSDCSLESSMRRPININVVHLNQNYLYGEVLNGNPKGHEGVDFSVGNAAIYSAYAGTVVYVRNLPAAQVTNSYGNCVVIEHTVDGKYVYTLYGHMQNSINVTTNSFIPQNQLLGYSGNTGNSTGAHLHFSVAESPTRITFSDINSVNSFFFVSNASRNPERYFYILSNRAELWVFLIMEGIYIQLFMVKWSN